MNEFTLSHALVTAPEPALPPDRWMIFAHGIFGSGANWRTFARRWVEVRPDWGAVLVDLRQHGRSLGLPPPNTIHAAARDLSTLDDALPQGTIRGIAGHSFGGKVALEYIALRHGDLDEAWILDSTPGARPGASGSEETEHVFSLLAALPKELPSRQAFSDALLAGGLSQGIVQWLAMNLSRDDSSTEPRYRYRLDLSAIRELLDDYFVRDLWPVVDSPPGAVTLGFVAGGRSSVFRDADRQRVEHAAARHPDRVSLDVIPEAGHWLHVDAPEALFKLLTRCG